MTRNLKVLFTTVLALGALGAIAASAQAADQFHCSAIPCRATALPDGTGKTTHQVFIVENSTTTETVAFTCEKITGEGTIAGGVANEIRMSNITYPNCTVNGSPGAKVTMNGCQYLLTGVGGTTDESELHIECPEGKEIEIEATSVGCIFKIGNKRDKGVGFNTVGTSPNREITVTAKEISLGGVGNNGKCASFILHPEAITYTTGNAILTGETNAGVMADAWYE